MEKLKTILYRIIGYFVFPNKGITHIKRNPKLIVSLTSHPGRIKVVDQTINSLLRQSLKPDYIILWLADSQFPKKEKSLPKSLLRYTKFGLQIRWCEDIRSYKKLIPTLKEFPNDIIVTTDDDVIYDENWLEMLYQSYLKNPQSIHCHHASQYYIDEELKITKTEILKTPGKLPAGAMAIGIGGILYPPYCLFKDICKKELFWDLAPQNDDFWFWAMETLSNTSICLVDGFIDNIVCIDGTQDTGLWESENSNGTGNRQLINILEHYPQLKKEFPSTQ